MHTATKVLIVRHAEALKTLDAVHGGKGTILTDQGRADVGRLTEFIGANFCTELGSAVVFTSHIPQVYETADIISHGLGIRMEKREPMRNINMGVVDGLSDEQAQQQFPQEMDRLAKWRRGELPVSEIRIPGAEPIADFVRRIASVMEEAFECRCSLIIFVVTRSVGIAILNLLLEHTELQGKGYVRFRMDPCSVTFVLVQDQQRGEVQYLNRSDFMGRPINYPDDRI